MFGTVTVTTPSDRSTFTSSPFTISVPSTFVISTLVALYSLGDVSSFVTVTSMLLNNLSYPVGSVISSIVITSVPISSISICPKSIIPFASVVSVTSVPSGNVTLNSAPSSFMSSSALSTFISCNL